MRINSDKDCEILFSSFPAPEEFYFLLSPGTRHIRKIYVNNNGDALEYYRVYVSSKPKRFGDTEIVAKDILKATKKAIDSGKALGKSVDDKFVISAIEKAVYQRGAQLCGGSVSGLN